MTVNNSPVIVHVNPTAKPYASQRVDVADVVPVNETRALHILAPLRPVLRRDEGKGGKKYPRQSIKRQR
eukprot:8890943-Pyramimonas_sp.AAC.1